MNALRWKVLLSRGFVRNESVKLSAALVPLDRVERVALHVKLADQRRIVAPLHVAGHRNLDQLESSRTCKTKEIVMTHISSYE